jgi:hypothetical protein
MKRNIIVGILFLTLVLYSNGLFDNFDKARKMLFDVIFKKYNVSVAKNVQAVYDALIKAGLPLQTIKLCIAQVLHETAHFNPEISKVAALNNNYSGITWVGSPAQKATGATKGSARQKSEGSNYAKYPNVISWAKDYIRILNLKNKPIQATGINDFVNRLAKNNYFDTDPVKYPNAVPNYLKNVTFYHNLLTKAGI